MPTDEALEEARALALGAARAIEAGGHESTAAEMLIRAARLAFHAAEDARRAAEVLVEVAEEAA